VTDELLQTKWRLPILQSHFLITRSHLFEQLDAGLAGRLTLISAPAGYGKTTLIGQWIRSRLEKGSAGNDRGLAICWVSLDDGDNDPVLFWSYVLAALEQAGISLGRQLLTSLTAPAAPPITAVITHLLNALETHEEQITFVLDDYHAINEGAVHEQVGYLIEHLSPRCHVILLTRADPPLPIARWRARRQMTEVRQVDLRFDIAETARLLNDMLALELTANDVAILERRTEGWVAGLQLVAIALGQQNVDRRAFIDSFAGSHHYIMTYLMDEVLQQLPEATQRFLEQTAVLRRLCAPLCSDVTGSKGCDLLLQELYRRNLFLIPLDDAHYWFRTHHLFAELLGTRLQNEHTQAEIERLHRRAAQWYDENHFLEEAIYHALRCGDMAWAAEMVEKYARPVMHQGRLNTLLRWIDALDPQALARRPRLRLDQAWSLFLSGQAARTKEILLDTRQSLQEDPGLALDHAIRGELAALLANCASIEADVEGVMVEVREALAYLPADDHVFRARALNAAGSAQGLAGDTEQLVAASQEVQRLALLDGNRFLAAHALSMIGDSRFQQGRLRDAEVAYRRIIELGTGQNVPASFVGMGYSGLAAVQLERYELAQAAQSLDQGLAISGQGGIGYKHLDAYCTLSRLRDAQGDAAEAAAALKQAQTFAPLPWHKVLLAAYAVRFWLGQGELAAAQHWLEGSLPRQAPVVVREVLEVTQARAALAEGNWPEVLALHDAVVTSAEHPSASRLARVFEMLLLRALALEALGERDEALESLEKVVSLAAPEGAVLTFLELGPDLAVLLRALRDRGRVPQPFTDQLLRLFPNTADSGMGMVEPLSDRELEVLRLIAAGKSNKDIAAALTVTLNTVKKHSSHIYGKLGVSGRTQAVARARELALI
jgi:LuxR family maltose regulon positive regulatory protein